MNLPQLVVCSLGLFAELVDDILVLRSCHLVVSNQGLVLLGLSLKQVHFVLQRKNLGLGGLSFSVDLDLQLSGLLFKSICLFLRLSSLFTQLEFFFSVFVQMALF